jgi:hypothetical protein
MSEEQEQKWQSIIWRGMVWQGYEFCRMSRVNATWQLEGTAVFAYEQDPCLLNYQIMCDANWCMNSAKVDGWVGASRIETRIVVEADHDWWLNGKEVPGVRGCIDLDLNFSPCTNTIAIRRLNPQAGEAVEMRAAWLKFPSFVLEPLDQKYHRLDDHVYRYESDGGRFKADLVVDQNGLVIEYPGIWIAERFS